MALEPTTVKLLALAALVAVQTLVAVIYRLAQRDGAYPFAPMSAIAMAEVAKLGLSLALHARHNSAQAASAGRPAEPLLAFVAQPKLRAHIPKIAVLAMLYFANNQLAFQLFLWADPASINLLKSSAIAVSALLWTVFFRRPIALVQWGAIAVQVCGMVIVQYDQCAHHPLLSPPVYGVLFLSVAITALCGVWNELQLKSLPLSLHQQNAVLYAVGAALNLAGYLARSATDPAYPAFFAGYHGVGIVIVLLNASIGLAVTAVYKYADALVKNLASALTTIAVLLLATVLFGTPLTVSVAVGSLVAVLATAMYLALDRPPAAAAAPPLPSTLAIGEADPEAAAAPGHPPGRGAPVRRRWRTGAMLVTVAVGCLVLVRGKDASRPAGTSVTSRMCVHFAYPQADPAGAALAAMAPFLTSCAANGITCTHGLEASLRGAMLYHGYIRRRAAATPACDDSAPTVFEFAVDLGDDAAYVHPPLASVPAYFKASWTAGVAGEVGSHLAGAFSTGDDHGHHGARSVGAAGPHVYSLAVRTRAAGPNPDLASYNRTVVLADYTTLGGGAAAQRLRLYETLRAIAPAWRDLDLHVRVGRVSDQSAPAAAAAAAAAAPELANGTDPDGGPAQTAVPQIMHASPRLAQQREPFTDRDYLRFVGEAYFLLHVPGSAGQAASQSARLDDACHTDTAVVSTPRAMMHTDFPHYELRGADPVQGTVNVALLRQELTFLLDHYQAVYARLIGAQRAWCDAHVGDLAYIHTILRHIPGQPFAQALLHRSPSLHTQLYGAG